MNGPSAAATAPKEAPSKGPIVWLDMDNSARLYFAIGSPFLESFSKIGAAF